MEKWESKGKRGWRVVKSKELKKIDSWEEMEEELGNNDLANGEDYREQSHM